MKKNILYLLLLLPLIAIADVQDNKGRDCNISKTEIRAKAAIIDLNKNNRKNIIRRTIVLRKNISLNSQLIYKNTLYIIKNDLNIGKDSKIEITIPISNVSHCISPLYEGELRKLQLYQSTGVGKRLSIIRDDGIATSMLITQKVIDAQQIVVNSTPKYYYYVPVQGKKGRALHIDGRKFVFLNKDKTHIDRSRGNVFCGDEEDFAYIATVYPGTYTFKESGLLIVPDGSVLQFDGGSIDNGVLYGNHTDIINNSNVAIFGDNITIAGLWDIDNINDTWFKYEYKEGVAKNEVIENILHLTHDDYYSVINISSGRNYLVEQKDVPIEHTGGIKQNILRYAYGLYNRYYIFRTEPLIYDIVLFDLPSNVKIVLNSTITMLPCTQGAYSIFDAYGKENVSIEGTGIIYGDNYDESNRHDYMSLPCWKSSNGSFYYGEWGHVVQLRGCSEINISGITISGAFGDAISAGYAIYDKETKTSVLPVGGALVSDRIVIKNVTIDWTRRNGISVAARSVLIDGCKITHTGAAEINGTAPKAAIDFEADLLNGNLAYGLSVYPEVGNHNCIVRNCLFDNNFFDLVFAENYNSMYDATSVHISNCALNKVFFTNHVKNVRLDSCIIKRINCPSENRKGTYELSNIKTVECKIEQMTPLLTNFISTK